MNRGFKLCFSLILFLGINLSPKLIAQTYTNHFGAGQTIGLNVTTSDAQGTNDGYSTVSGTDLIPDLIGASRFLGQATMGASYEDIEYVSQIGIEAWLEEQINLPYTTFATTYRGIYDEAVDMIAVAHAPDSDSTRRNEYLNYAFYQKLLTEEDQLRQKIAFALSQVFVTSYNSDLNDRGFATASYYDLLYEGAFGNFHDLLLNITLHPAMGIYLSTFQNRKADPDAGTLPDENYAREVMQLFTIGLFEMNNDGSLKMDANGDFIPTYDIKDIQELSKVFTGLSGADWDLLKNPQNEGSPLVFYKGKNHYDLTVPMAMYEDYHETSQKIMLDGSIIPAGQPGIQDIEDAIEILFNHPNVGPFLSIRFIQQLVKSNPSPEYINRVATVFNDNGQGVRGDLEAVFRAVLTDPEARECSWIDDVKGGKLKQPVERFTNLFKAFDIQSPSGKFWYKDYTFIYNKVEQSFMVSPTVFNFFSPFYSEPEHVAPNNMVSPEYQILHSTTGIHYINLIETAVKTRPFKNRTMASTNGTSLANNDADEPFLDFSDEVALYEAEGIEALIDRLNILICNGQLSDNVRILIENAYYQYDGNINSYDSSRAVEDVLYFMMVSSDYTVLR